MQPIQHLTQTHPRLFTRGAVMVLLAAACVSAPAPAAADNNGTAIRPFRVRVPQAALSDLRRRLAATRWPDRETVADGSQGP